MNWSMFLEGQGTYIVELHVASISKFSKIKFMLVSRVQNQFHILTHSSGPCIDVHMVCSSVCQEHWHYRLSPQKITIGLLASITFEIVLAMCIELATQKGWRRYAFPHFISFILQYLGQTERCIRAHLKANLVLYQSCKYELSRILNGDRALDRIQHGEGGRGGGGGTHKVYGKTCVAR